MHAAARYQAKDCLRVLLERGADLSVKDQYDNTLLLAACGDASAMTMLLDRGANVNAPGQARTPPRASRTPRPAATEAGCRPPRARRRRTASRRSCSA